MRHLPQSVESTKQLTFGYGLFYFLPLYPCVRINGPTDVHASSSAIQDGS